MVWLRGSISLHQRRRLRRGKPQLDQQKDIRPAVRRLKQIMTMDYILLAIVICFSVFWAVVFNSIDDPMENQPIELVIDVKRNLLNFGCFLGYFIQFFAVYVSGYLLYWVNHHILINRVMARFGVFHYVWTAVAFTLVASPTLSQIALFLPINTGELTLLPSGNHDPFDDWNLRIAFVIMVFSLPLILSFKWLQQEAELATLKQENVQTELKWLQQQINPHFLFNTLNNLYALTLAKSDQAPQSILQLANLLRFVVYQGGKDQVTLQDEIQYLNDYIALQNIRVKHKTQIEFTVTDEVKEQASSIFIAPLMIVMLVENAFKHGIDKTDKASWLKLRLALRGSELQVSCENSVDTDVSTLDESDETDDSSGLGFDNLLRRLELIYPQRHHLNISSKETEFCVNLTVELDNHA